MRQVLTLPDQRVATLIPTATDKVKISNVAMFTTERILEEIGRFIEEKNMRNASARLYARLTLEYDDQEKD